LFSTEYDESCSGHAFRSAKSGALNATAGSGTRRAAPSFTTKSASRTGSPSARFGSFERMSFEYPMENSAGMICIFVSAAIAFTRWMFRK
jgi:hypothetical protein